MGRRLTEVSQRAIALLLRMELGDTARVPKDKPQRQKAMYGIVNKMSQYKVLHVAQQEGRRFRTFTDKGDLWIVRTR